MGKVCWWVSRRRESCIAERLPSHPWQSKIVQRGMGLKGFEIFCGYWKQDGGWWVSQQATATEAGLKLTCASSRLQECWAKLPGKLVFPHWHRYWNMPLWLQGSGSLVLSTGHGGEARIFQWRSTTYRKEMVLGLGFFTLIVIPTYDSNLGVFRFSAGLLNYQSLSFLWLLFFCHERIRKGEKKE